MLPVRTTRDKIESAKARVGGRALAVANLTLEQCRGDVVIGLNTSNLKTFSTARQALNRLCRSSSAVNEFADAGASYEQCTR